MKMVTALQVTRYSPPNYGNIYIYIYIYISNTKQCAKTFNFNLIHNNIQFVIFMKDILKLN